ncbi:PIN domain-containing protein [Myceligenerans salitolerans]|uniref:PIN domain-containing protein n=1 Tax=Myceligenerans salitolerans TaxID=1230528 RepID=A0ABS3IC35_9MICO|nr:PIN domain-containing protein [Myceligenerans salitolerans]MBO0610600.1 PIN domain-containing protein [Myceligenerans salitolerans]
MTAADRPRVVLSDANVLFSRVLRDYLLYAADQELITILWSDTILGEMTRHLVGKVDGFTTAQGERLVAGMNRAYPGALVELTEESTVRVAALTLPDEDDRHVLAAAVEGGAEVVCTANLKDFPIAALSELGLEVRHPDEVLTRLVRRRPIEMLAVHRVCVERLKGATDESTIAALRRADAPRTADLIEALLIDDARSRRAAAELSGELDELGFARVPLPRARGGGRAGRRR